MTDSIRGYRINSSDDKPIGKQETDYLRPKKGSQTPLEELRDGVAVLGSNCLNRWDEFTDYEEPPTDEEARAMCAGCPVFDLCKRAEETSHPAWGVWAGNVHGRELVEKED